MADGQWRRRRRRLWNGFRCWRVLLGHNLRRTVAGLRNWNRRGISVQRLPRRWQITNWRRLRQRWQFLLRGLGLWLWRRWLLRQLQFSLPIRIGRER